MSTPFISPTRAAWPAFHRSHDGARPTATAFAILLAAAVAASGDADGGAGGGGGASSSDATSATDSASSQSTSSGHPASSSDGVGVGAGGGDGDGDGDGGGGEGAGRASGTGGASNGTGGSSEDGSGGDATGVGGAAGTGGAAQSVDAASTSSSGMGQGGAGDGGAGDGGAGDGGANGDDWTLTFYGVRWDWDDDLEYFGHYDPMTGDFEDISVLEDVGVISGAMTGDSLARRFYVGTDEGQLTVDVDTGDVVDVSPLWQYVNVDADPLEGTLFGMRFDTDDGELSYGKVDPATGAFEELSVIPGVESTNGGLGVDPVGRRYFARVDFGLVTLDLDTGAVLDVVSDPDEVSGMRVDPSTGTVYAFAWDADAEEEDFGVFDPQSGVFEARSALPGVLLHNGVGGLDPSRSEIYLVTNLGFLTIDVASGEIVRVVDSPEVAGLVSFYAH